MCGCVCKHGDSIGPADNTQHSEQNLFRQKESGYKVVEKVFQENI